MNIALIYPPSPFLIDEKIMPPLGLLYLASVLENNGHNVSFIDLSGISDWRNSVYDALRSDAIGIYATTPQFETAREIAEYLKGKNPRVRIILGGPHASGSKKISSVFDVVVRGEGERAILEALHTNERYIRSPLIENLDEIPFPDRSLIQGYRYTISGKPATTMITSRGCPYRCAFCDSFILWGRRPRYRSAQNVLEEARQLRDMGYSGVMFYDDEMLMNQERDRSIFRGLAQLGLVSRCFTRTNLVNEELLRFLKDCGLVQICFGIESGSQKILDTVRKGTSVEQNKRALELCREVGLSTKIFMIVGLPGESPETIDETDRFLSGVPFNDIDVALFVPYPGSDIYEHRERYDIIFDPNFKPSDAWFKGKPGGYKSIVSTSSMTAEKLERARDMLEKKYKKWELN